MGIEFLDTRSRTAMKFRNEAKIASAALFGTLRSWKTHSRQRLPKWNG